jgi:VCBS repeat protein
LVVADQLRTTVDVYLGTGDGTFRFSNGLVAPDTPTAVAVADVSSPSDSPFAGAPDGNPDVVVGSDAGDVWILIGRGNGRFPTYIDVSNAVDAGSVIGFALGDFNNDGRIDIAVGDDADDSVEFLCSGGGMFASCPTPVLDSDGAGMIEIVTGDFDGDGALDVATLNRDTGDVSPMYGNGKGTFAAVAATLPARGEGDRPSAFAVAKLHSGPSDDLVIANYGTFDEYFGVALLGRQRNVFAVGPFIMEFMTTSLAVTDFNGDGAPDVLAPNRVEKALSINFGDGSGALTDPYSAGSSLLDPGGYRYRGCRHRRRFPTGFHRPAGRRDEHAGGHQRN